MKSPARTPEGQPNRCQICGKRFWLDPSLPSRDAPCPHCGCLVWFADRGPGRVLNQQERAQAEQEVGELVNLLVRLGTARLGPPAPVIRDAIDTIHYPEALANMTRRVLEVKSWKDLVWAED